MVVLLLLWHIWYDDKFMDRLFCVIFLVCFVSPAICHLSYVIIEWIRQTSAKLFIENIFRALSSSTFSTHTHIQKSDCCSHHLRHCLIHYVCVWVWSFFRRSIDEKPPSFLPSLTRIFDEPFKWWHFDEKREYKKKEIFLDYYFRMFFFLCVCE